MHLACIIVGEFNITISPEEKEKGPKVRDPFGERLEDIMNVWRLVDIKPKRDKYTWSNKHIAARLDRILVSSSFLDKPFLSATRLLASAIFYHRPILFSLEPIGNLGPLPFKFSPTWIGEKGFFDIVFQAWQKFYQGSPSLILEKKLKNVKRELKAWLQMRNQFLR